MDENNVEITIGVTRHHGVPFIEVRARALGDDGPIPKGKLFVSRTPILPPGASEEEIAAMSEERLVDDDGETDLCPLCPTDLPHTGRNAPCPCGSGTKYKKCCLELFERHPGAS